MNGEVSLAVFNQALMHIGAPCVDDDAALEQLIRARSMETVTAAIRGALDGVDRAVNTVRQYGQVTGLLAQLPRIGMRGTTYNQARDVLKSHGLNAVRETFSKAKHGNPRERRILSNWLCEAANQTVDAPQQAPAAAGQPPAAPMGQAQQRSTGQVRRTTQERGTVTTLPPPAQTSSMPAHQANVTHLPERPSCRPEPESQQAPTGTASGHDQSTDAPRTLPQRVYDDAKAYGGRAALTFCADQTKDGVPTVCIEAAEGSNRVYNWADKLRFQLTQPELELVVALLAHDLEKVHFSNHNDKWMTAEWQTGQYAGTIKFTLGKGKANEFRPRTVQVDYSAHAPIYSLFLRQCARTLKCTAIEVRGRVVHAARMYHDAQAARGQRQPARATA